jgi:hypothetical protein
LAQSTRHRVSVSSSGIVPSQRYSVIGFHQSASGLGCPMTVATSPLGPGLGAIGPTEAPGLASGVGAEPFSLGRVPDMGIEVPSSGEVPGKRTGTSSWSRMEGLNKFYVNTPGGIGSRLDLSQVRASAVRCLVGGYDEA